MAEAPTSEDLSAATVELSEPSENVDPQVEIQVKEQEKAQVESDKPPDVEELPPLTYIDFVPQCFGSKLEGKEPQFAEFGTLLEQANQWLLSMPQFSVFKCETITTKLGQEFNLDNDITVLHTSSNGKNVYLRSLRLWLVPKVDVSLPVQQLAYITVLPDHASGDVKNVLKTLASTSPAGNMSDPNFPAFENLHDTIEKMNIHLQAKPLSGRILTFETITYKCQESNNADELILDGTCWTETGSNAKVYLHAFRIFFIVGQPAFETIGIHDEVPDMLQNREGMGLRVKLSTFAQTVGVAGNWLQAQKGIRVANIQSVHVKLDRRHGTGPWLIDPGSPGYTENQSLSESRFVKIMRIAYVKEQKLDNPSPYASITLTSKLFIPNRLGGKTFDTFSKTILRVIQWLNATRIPVFACETVRYHLTSPEGYGIGINEDRSDHIISNFTGQHYVTCIRLYFPSVYQEPPPEIPEVEEVSWRCVIS